jgi:hypothetical protein
MTKTRLLRAARAIAASILILLGILDEVKHEPQLLSYEYPFGVGYLTMEFKL